MKEFLSNIWIKCVEYYSIYSDFIHSIFPKELGDLIEGVLDIAIVCIIVKLISTLAFGTRNNG